MIIINDRGERENGLLCFDIWLKKLSWHHLRIFSFYIYRKKRSSIIYDSMGSIDLNNTSYVKFCNSLVVINLRRFRFICFFFKEKYSVVQQLMLKHFCTG